MQPRHEQLGRAFATIKPQLPHRAIAITPDGKTVYVINDTYAGTRAPIGPAVSVALENRPVRGPGKRCQNPRQAG